MQDAELIVEFVDEAREHLADIEMQLLQIEVLGSDVNDDLVNTVFRAIHSVKGAAGFLGLVEINQVAHRLENVLGRVREHELVPDPFNVDVMLKAADRLRTLIEAVDSSNDTDNRELCKKLDALLAEIDSTGGALHDHGKRPPQPEIPSQSESDTSHVSDRAEETLTTIEAQLLTDAPLDAKPESEVKASGQTTKTASFPGKPTSAQPTSAVGATAATTPPPGTPPVPSKPSASGSETTIRVGVRVLDRLMNLRENSC